MLKGKVTEGLGEGQYYLQIDKYNRALKRILSCEPFHGTLNLVVNIRLLHKFLKQKQKKQITGFKTKVRAFGAIDYYHVEIFKLANIENKIKALLIQPHRTSHPDNIAEIVAPYYLRDKLNLKDGDVVVVE